MTTRLRSQRGTTLVEFALLLPFILVLTVSVVDLSRAFLMKNILATAAREGVRYLTVRTLAEADEVEDRVREVAQRNGTVVSNVDVTEDNANEQVQVTAEAEFTWLYPGMFSWIVPGFTNPTTLSASAIMHKETPVN